MRSLAALVLVSVAAVVSPLAGCSASDMNPLVEVEAGGGRTPAPTVPPPGPDADAGTTPTGAARACPEKTAVEAAPGVFFVNAATRFGAFRVCPAAGTSGTASEGRGRPLPTAKMPRSNLSGVDTASLVRVAAAPDLTGADVIVLKIDDAAKQNPLLETGTCADLVCGVSGAGCLTAGNVVRVPVVRAGAPAPGALATAGTIGVLRDDGPGLRFEVDTVRAVKTGCVGDLDVDFHDFVAGSGSVAVTPAANDGRPGPSFVLPSDYAAASFRSGGHEETLAAVHEHSDPRASIDTFYRSPGAFLLVLVGEAGARHFAGVPVNGVVERAADAGSD